MSTSTSAPDRLHYLDGLRGWAELAVVNYHVIWETFGSLIPALRTNYAGPADNGALAVYIFFVISGIVLSYRALQTGEMRRVQRMALGRFPRLLVPVACAASLGFLGQKFGVFANQNAGFLVGREDWLSVFYNRPPSFMSLIKWSIWDVWFDYNLSQSYGPFLWTISVELMGSFVIFALIAISNGSRSTRCFFYIVMLAYGWRLQTFLLPFFSGLILAEIMVSRLLDRLPFANYVGIGLFVLGCIGSVFVRYDYSVHKLTLVAWLVVAGCVLSPTLRGMLETRPSRWLGRVSFPLYLVHSLILCSVGSWLIVWLSPHQTPWAVFAVVAPTTIALSLIAAKLFLPVERVAVNTSHAFAMAVLGTTSRAESILRRPSSIV